jgi:hypothetical protein
VLEYSKHHTLAITQIMQARLPLELRDSVYRHYFWESDNVPSQESGAIRDRYILDHARFAYDGGPRTLVQKDFAGKPTSREAVIAWLSQHHLVLTTRLGNLKEDILMGLFSIGITAAHSLRKISLGFSLDIGRRENLDITLISSVSNFAALLHVPQRRGLEVRLAIARYDKIHHLERVLEAL